MDKTIPRKNAEVEMNVYNKQIELQEGINLDKRKTEIISLIKKENEDYSPFRIFTYISELYEIEKKTGNKRVTLRQISKEIEMDETNVYRIMSFKKANPRTLRLIRQGKISVMKVMRILFRVHQLRQDEFIDFVIANNLSTTKIDDYAIKFRDKNINYARKEIEYENNWNYSRGIEVTGIKMINLLSTDIKIPDSRKKDVNKILKELKDKLNSWLK